MKWESLYYDDKLLVVNRSATVAIISCWTDPLEILGALIPEERANVAVIGSLYGDGFRYLLRNLLWNPQIESVVVMGRDRSGSACYLSNFLKDSYDLLINNNGTCSFSVHGSKDPVVIDDLVSPDMLSNLNVYRSTCVRLPMTCFRHSSNTCTKERVNIQLPKVDLTAPAPSHVGSHTIVEATPEEAHISVLQRIKRFAPLVKLKKGDRFELRDLKVVITKPEYVDTYRQYQEEMLDETFIYPYTYGNRLKQQLIDIRDNLSDPDDRRGYATTWHINDITNESRPCLVGLNFSVRDKKLYLTATFRSHNATSAWLKNTHGLIGYMEFVKGEFELGELTIISHSISIDPMTMVDIPDAHFREVRDPNGYFLFDVRNGFIIAEHIVNGEVFDIYKSKKASRIQHEIYRDLAVSDLNHAMYIGGQLKEMEMRLNDCKNS